MPRKKYVTHTSKELPKTFFEKFKYAAVFNFDLRLEKSKGQIKESWSNPDHWNFIEFLENYCRKCCRGNWHRLGKYFYFDNIDDILWVKFRYNDDIKKIIDLRT